jgi:2-amino-4-hydroxy-6-hydroxymethyldihydropteridine diphosphokinase
LAAIRAPCFFHRVTNMRCLVALGSNLGDRAHSLAQAVELLSTDPNVYVIARSSWRETAAVGGTPGQEKFLNGVVCLETGLAPPRLFGLLERIEERLGRTRPQRWGARTIDLDLLLYGEQVIGTPRLLVPHPRMAFRRFVLEPASEAAPDMLHPTTGWTIRQLLAHLNGAPPYVALLGPARSGKTALAQSLSRHFGGRFIADLSRAQPMGAALNPPSHVYRRQIEFLDRRLSDLRRQPWHNRSELAISDFYLDQTLAYARIELNAAEYEAFYPLWREAQEQVARPKLLAVLDDIPMPQSSGAEPGTSHPEAQTEDRLRVELLRLAARREIGPVVYAGCAQQQAQFDEIAAAIVAMQ